MKLTVVTAKKSTLVNLNDLKIASDEPKRSVKNFDCEKNEIAKYYVEADHNFS